MLIANLEDKISACYATDTIQFTDFLTLEEMDSCLSLVRDVGLNFKIWGGYPDAERKMIALWLQDMPADFPVSILCGSYDHFAEIGHRDILGAIMSCGIERKCIGDILPDPQNRKFYVFVVERMRGYITENIDRIGRCSVKWSVLDDVSTLPIGSVKAVRLPVASLRIDCILAAIYHLSRQKSQDLISEKKVYINHALVTKTTQNVPLGASVVVRGFGKFVLLEQNGFSKKGKTYITLKQYL